MARPADARMRGALGLGRRCEPRRRSTERRQILAGRRRRSRPRATDRRSAGRSRSWRRPAGRRCRPRSRDGDRGLDDDRLLRQILDVEAQRAAALLTARPGRPAPVRRACVARRERARRAARLLGRRRDRSSRPGRRTRPASPSGIRALRRAPRAARDSGRPAATAPADALRAGACRRRVRRRRPGLVDDRHGVARPARPASAGPPTGLSSRRPPGRPGRRAGRRRPPSSLPRVPSATRPCSPCEARRRAVTSVDAQPAPAWTRSISWPLHCVAASRPRSSTSIVCSTCCVQVCHATVAEALAHDTVELRAEPIGRRERVPTSDCVAVATASALCSTETS